MVVFLSDLAVWFKMYPHQFEAMYVCYHAWSDSAIFFTYLMRILRPYVYHFP